MFEAVHGSAPDIAGRDIANPSGLLIAATQMLVHLGLSTHAQTIKNAWLRTIEEGIHTSDIFREGVSHKRVGTRAFANAIIERLGTLPEKLAPASYPARSRLRGAASITTHPSRTRTSWRRCVPLLERARPHPRCTRPFATSEANGDGLELSMITNRGLKVWPNGAPETFCTDHWRCRFEVPEGAPPLQQAKVFQLLTRVGELGFDVIKTEHLYTFDGEPGYSLGQGQ